MGQPVKSIRNTSCPWWLWKCSQHTACQTSKHFSFHISLCMAYALDRDNDNAWCGPTALFLCGKCFFLCPTLWKHIANASRPLAAFVEIYIWVRLHTIAQRRLGRKLNLQTLSGSLQVVNVVSTSFHKFPRNKYSSSDAARWRRAKTLEGRKPCDCHRQNAVWLLRSCTCTSFFPDAIFTAEQSWRRLVPRMFEVERDICEHIFRSTWKNTRFETYLLCFLCDPHTNTDSSQRLIFLLISHASGKTKSWQVGCGGTAKTCRFVRQNFYFLWTKIFMARPQCVTFCPFFTANVVLPQECAFCSSLACSCQCGYRLGIAMWFYVLLWLEDTNISTNLRNDWFCQVNWFLIMLSTPSAMSWWQKEA